MIIKEIHNKFLEHLVKKGLLRERQIEEIKSIIKNSPEQSFRKLLVKGGFIDSEKLAQNEAEFYGYPYVNLSELQISAELIKLLPSTLAEKYSAVCFSQEGFKYKIALIDIEDFNARDAIDFWASSKNFTVQYYLCSYDSWKDAMRKYGSFGVEIESAINEAKDDKVDEVNDVSTDNIEQVIKNAPVSQIVSMIVKYGIESRASDIHIEPHRDSARVRYRIDGVLQTVLVLPIAIYDSIISRIKVLSQLKIDETRVPQDGRFKFKVSKTVSYDVRVSIMPLEGSEKATLRVLDSSKQALTLEQLGFSSEMQSVMMSALKESYGMILSTGPTGSGKSTSLFSLLSLLNKDGVNICTLEDPIEYYTAGINQAQIRPEVGFTFASGLRALMRQDPDIIMVGEIRDNETAEMAIHAALTGHLLFATLHTNDSIGAIPRLIDMKVEPFLIASTINLIIAQRLARRICSKCKEPYELPSEVANKVRQQLSSVDPTKIPIDISGRILGYRGKGCNNCKNTGYTGRVVLAEALPITKKLRMIISEGFKIKEVQQELAGLGMINLVQDGIIKALQGITTFEDVFRVSKEVDEQE